MIKRQNIQPIIERLYQEETVGNDGDIVKLCKYISQLEADKLEDCKLTLEEVDDKFNKHEDTLWKWEHKAGYIQAYKDLGLLDK